ncbi:hypothetical protein B0H17DRAFT_150667 [Mycena rosella]|uniref:Uncharacterized protein n=1 Tax=Mycena rosella TaxID=1033263 RepID=A0AAD7D209_MYCRO|nr:hypothetical protein B0H17DRAFT_150667 [Mycena rosella]
MPTPIFISYLLGASGVILSGTATGPGPPAVKKLPPRGSLALTGQYTAGYFGYSWTGAEFSPHPAERTGSHILVVVGYWHAKRAPCNLLGHVQVPPAPGRSPSKLAYVSRHLSIP